MTRYLGKGLEGPLRGSTGDGTGSGRRAASKTSFRELVEVDGEVPSLECVSYACSTDRMMWHVTFKGTGGQLVDYVTIGHVFDVQADDDPRERLRAYLERTRLPNGLYGLRDDDGDLVTDFWFVRAKALPPVKSLRRRR